MCIYIYIYTYISYTFTCVIVVFYFYHKRICKFMRKLYLCSLIFVYLLVHLSHFLDLGTSWR
jgi:hypothetical protein